MTNTAAIFIPAFSNSFLDEILLPADVGRTEPYVDMLLFDGNRGARSDSMDVRNESGE